MLERRTAIATNRFGLGARPGDASRIGDASAAWLEDQIVPTTRVPGRAAGSRPRSAVVLEQFGELRLARQAARSRLTDTPLEVDERAIREFSRFVSSSYESQAASGCIDAIASEQPFRERLVRFWQNHFAVSADKQPIGTIAGLYRDEAIRPHVTGNFRELLTAVVRHPAMLLYLDNQASIGPNSLLGSRANRNRQAGLNENLAREILELHTLGVDGGYTQEDVIEFSKALTGWSIAGQIQGNSAALEARIRRLDPAYVSAAPGEFQFRAAVHEPGPKTILGTRFGEGGVDEAEAVLAYLARQPETARYLAAKLARHFVADEPPADLVERLADTYLEHDGELAPVYRALVRADESWREPLAKQKTPEDFLISSYRALGTTPPGVTFVALATQLGQRPLTPGSPAGWPDEAAAWNGGDALLKRIEWATTVGASIGDRIDASARLDDVLGEVASEATRQGVARAESGAQAIAIMISAPEFQRR